MALASSSIYGSSICNSCKTTIALKEKGKVFCFCNEKCYKAYCKSKVERDKQSLMYDESTRLKLERNEKNLAHKYGPNVLHRSAAMVILNPDDGWHTDSDSDIEGSFYTQDLNNRIETAFKKIKEEEDAKRKS